MQIDFSDLSATQRYHLMTQSIIPRPIAWALTDSSNGSFNLAPFSYFTAVSSDPPLLMISVGKKPNGDDKDTLKNVLDNKTMVIHIAAVEQAQLVTQTAATLAHGDSEIDATNLTTTPFDDFPLPRISECNIAFGCELFEIKALGDGAQTLIFMEIKQLYMSDHVVVNEDPMRIKVSAEKVAPLSRLGGGEYAAMAAAFSLQRPK